MNLVNYCPESSKVEIGGKQISGLAETFIENASKAGFELNLHVGSDSAKDLLELVELQDVNVSIHIDLWEGNGNHIDLFDIKGAFTFEGWSFKLGTTFPEIKFKFSK
jgi:hypothetical protein